MELVYKNEKSLFTLAIVLAAIVWLALLIGTVGLILIYVLLAWLIYLFVQSGFIAWLKGNGVEVTPEQLPELYGHFDECCQKLDIEQKPRLFLINGSGMLNALATKFLRTQYVVLFSNTVDALERKPSLIKFYLGHELGHLKQRHLFWGPLLFPVLWLPLLGAAYSRAREYTCDRHGLACADNTADACFSLAVLAAGERKWSEVKFTAYAQQVEETGGFWMSFHELCADYPWLTKRIARLQSASRGEDGPVPSRNPFAYLLALLVPRTGAGAGAAGPLIMVAVIGILAAVALPAYKDYQQRAAEKAMEAELAQLEAQQQAEQEYAGGDEYGTTTDSQTGVDSSANDEALAQALTGMKIVAVAYINAYQANPTTTVTLENMAMSQADLTELGILGIEFSEYAMTATLNATNAYGDYHYVRLAGGYEEDGSGMYAQCSDSSLTPEQLTGICR